MLSGSYPQHQKANNKLWKPGCSSIFLLFHVKVQLRQAQPESPLAPSVPTPQALWLLDPTLLPWGLVALLFYHLL